MITKERLMELLVQAGSEIGIIPKRLPAGWVRFGELVEQETRETLKDCTHVIVNRTLPPLEDEWRRYYEKGYRYGTDAMGGVKLGYQIAGEVLARLQQGPSMPVSRTALADGTTHASDCSVHGVDTVAGIVRGVCDCGAPQAVVGEASDE